MFADLVRLNIADEWLRQLVIHVGELVVFACQLGMNVAKYLLIVADSITDAALTEGNVTSCKSVSALFEELVCKGALRTWESAFVSLKLAEKRFVPCD